MSAFTFRDLIDSPAEIAGWLTMLASFTLLVGCLYATASAQLQPPGVEPFIWPNVMLFVSGLASVVGIRIKRIGPGGLETE